MTPIWLRTAANHFDTRKDSRIFKHKISEDYRDRTGNIQKNDRDFTESVCGKASALRENAKAEHRRFVAGDPGISARISHLCPYSGQLWDSGKQYLPRNQMGGRYSGSGRNLLTA